MSLDPTTDFTNDDDGAQNDGAQQGGGALRHVREALERTTQAKAEAEQRAAMAESELETARRELALSKVKLPDFQGKNFFLENYHGDPTQEAVEAAALAAGFAIEVVSSGEQVLTPTPAAAPVVPQAELDAHRAINAAAAGSTAPGDIPLDKALLDAKSPEEVLAILNQVPNEAGVRVAPNIIP